MNPKDDHHDTGSRRPASPIVVRGQAHLRCVDVELPRLTGRRRAQHLRHSRHALPAAPVAAAAAARLEGSRVVVCSPDNNKKKPRAAGSEAVSQSARS